MNIDDISDYDFDERYAHFQKQFSGGYASTREIVVTGMLNEIHVMLRELLNRIPANVTADFIPDPVRNPNE